MTGKLADTVMSVRNGEQLARKYQPIVFNPSTPAQVAQRAKLKLLSQLSAVMAPVIAFRKVGSVSSRNLFTKKNFSATTYAANTASVNLESVKLTSSVIALPDISLVRGTSSITASLVTAYALDLSRVCYAAFLKQGDNTLRLIANPVVNASADDINFSATINLEGQADEVVVYAYGVRDNTETARVVFGNLEAPLTSDIAHLITTSVLTESDITLTETKADTSVPAEGNHAPAPVDDGNRRAFKKK